MIRGIVNSYIILSNGVFFVSYINKNANNNWIDGVIADTFLALDRGSESDSAFDYKALYYYLFNEISSLIEELHIEGEGGAQEHDSRLRIIKSLEKLQIDAEEFVLNTNSTEQRTPIHNGVENSKNIITIPKNNT